MNRVIVFDKDSPSIGLFARKNNQGEEFELVTQFINYYCERFEHDNKSSNLAVFVEPRIASGFPDIVFATYAPNIMDNWSNERSLLDTIDLKVLSHIILSNGCNGKKIITGLKLSENQVINSIEKLLDSRLIFRGEGFWKSRDRKNVYSIKKLVSVEAKINNIKRVTEQSIINTWFASHSYALTSSNSPRPVTLNGFQRHGIGLYCKTRGFKKVLEAQQFSLPSSYLSLQFNEWIGNALHQA